MNTLIMTSRVFLIAMLSSILGSAQVGGPYIPGIPYWGQNQYVEYIPGTAPIVISSPHGGRLQPSSIPDRTFGVIDVDRRTQEMAIELADVIMALTGKRPHVILSQLHRVKLDPNREIVEAAQGDPIAEQAWHDFHDFIVDARTQITTQYGKGLYIDIHGHGHPEPWIEFGYTLNSAILNLSDGAINTQANIDNCSLRSVASQPGVSFPEVLRGATSIGGLVESAGFSSVPSPANHSPAGGNYFAGGHNTILYGSELGGTIDGLQIEFPSSLRLTRQARDLITPPVAAAIVAFVQNHQGVVIAADPVVTMTATDGWASECGSRGKVTVHRSGNVSQSLTLPIEWSGSAVIGVDFYATIGNQIMIPAGRSTASFDIVPLDDNAMEGDETVLVRLTDFVTSGGAHTATVVIRDDETDTHAEMSLDFNETSGTMAFDQTSHGRNGTLLPSVANGPQRIGREDGMALSFDGVDDDLRVNDFPWSPVGTATIAFHFRTSSTATSGFQYIFSQGGLASVANTLNIYFISASGVLRSALSYDNDLSIFNTLDVDLPLRDGTWHHYALTTSTTGRSRIYIDGIVQAETFLGGDTLDPSTDIFLGGRFDQNMDRHFQGDLDEVRIYSRELSTPEITALAEGLPKEAEPYPGTHDDFRIVSGVDSLATVEPIKSAAGGQVLTVHIDSPQGTFFGAWSGLGLQPMLTGLPPYQPHLPLVYLFQGSATESIPFTVLGPMGLSASGFVPPGLQGFSALFQGYVFSNAATNGSYAMTDGHEIRLF